jgi:hypothetical protein
MIRKKPSSLCMFSAGLVLALLVSLNSPTGACHAQNNGGARRFQTPALSKHPDSKSISNGIPEPPNDTFAWTRQTSRRGKETTSSSAPCITLRFVPIAIREPVPVDPAKSPKCGRDTSMPMAISYTRPSSLITARIYHRPFAHKQPCDLPPSGGAFAAYREHSHIANRAQYPGRRLRRVEVPVLEATGKIRVGRMNRDLVRTLSPHLCCTFLTVHTNRLEQNYRNGATYHAQYVPTPLSRTIAQNTSSVRIHTFQCLNLSRCGRTFVPATKTI